MIKLSAAEIRSRLDHPIIDVDGHLIEATPVFEDYVADVVGRDAAGRLRDAPAWASLLDFDRWATTSESQRRHHWMVATPWWGAPPRTLDRASAFLPRLLAGRLDELGIDFTILYPSLGLVVARLRDEELRRGACRALNTYMADVTRDHAERMTVPATIPMHSPAEALAELEHAVGVLGLRCIVVPGYVDRAVPALVDLDGAAAQRAARVDPYAIDSDYDYDPVWERCTALGVAVTSHAGSMGVGFRQSPSRYMYNHIGQFGAAHEALAKALFFGGVTRRFPRLNFAFLEGGVGWAVNLYADLIGRWEKRGGPHILALDPERVDWEEFDGLLDAHGGAALVDPGVRAVLRRYSAAHPTQLDDFSACGIERAEDICERFVPRFFFGCEADDPINVWAFSERTNPLESRLQAMLGSDLGHWDVLDMREVIPESYEPVERGLLSEADFRDFVCDNAVRLHAGMNADFFSGTSVETYAKDFLSRGR